MLRRMLAVITGLIVGGICVFMVEQVSVMLHPFPEDVDTIDREAMKQYISSLPMSAFIIVLTAHAVGAFAGGFASAAVTRQSDWCPRIVGLILMGGGIMNLIMIPHPLWFGIADVIVYLPLAILGGIVGLKMFGGDVQP